jgi:hypothetical protein
MVMRTVAFLVVRRIPGLVGLGPSPDAKDVEIAVLRHQLMVLQRQVARPRHAPSDRWVLATLARLLSHDRWRVYLVTPATLLGWHREPVPTTLELPVVAPPGVGPRGDRPGVAPGAGESALGLSHRVRALVWP